MQNKADPKRPAYSQERVAHITRLCARGFNRALSRRLAEHSVSFGQWIFLRILWKEEGLSQRQLSERANLTEPTVHAALSRMEKQGLVVRRAQPGNRRKQHTFLTEEGRDLQEQLEPLAVQVNNVALDGLSEARREALRQDLIQVLENLERDEAEAEARGLKVPPTRSAFGD